MKVADVSIRSPADLRKTYRVYPWRWFVLATVSLLALSNAAVWIGYTSIAVAVDSFYCDDPADCDVAYWTSQIMQITGALMGILGMLITDKYGIKLSCITGSVLNFIGVSIRLLSITDLLGTPTTRRIVLYVGQTIAALAQSFYLCLSPKVAEFWFSDHQRTLANSIGFIANPVGVIIGSLAPKLIVGNATTIADYQFCLFIINAMLWVPSTICLIMSLLVGRSRPPTPPSASMETHSSPPFFKGLWIILRKKAFYIQMVTSGMGTAIIFALFFACEQMFTELGYDYLNGYGMALCSVVGCTSSLLTGHFVDCTKKFHETVKVLYLGTALSAIAINIVLRLEANSTLNLVLLFVFVAAQFFFGTPTWPVGLELGVETTFPVAEATSSGVLITCGQIEIFALGYLMKWVSDVDVLYDHTATSKNFQLAVDLWCALSVATALFSYFFLWPKYKRLEFEKKRSLSMCPSDLSKIAIPN